MKIVILGALLVLTTKTLAFGATDVPSETAEEQIIHSDVLRINSSKTIRTYSQKVPALGCFLYNEIEPTANVALLQKANKDVEQHLLALREGNPELGILEPEVRKKTLDRISAVDDVWSEISKAVDLLTNDPDNKAAMEVLKGRNIELFEVTDLLVTELSGQYAVGNILDKSNAMRLNVVARAAATTQKIAKNLCMAVTYPENEIYGERLAESATIFENSLKALRSGLPELGIQAAPTPEISEMLDKAIANWEALRGDVDAVAKTRSISAADKSELFSALLVEMQNIEEISLAYKVYAKYDY